MNILYCAWPPDLHPVCIARHLTGSVCINFFIHSSLDTDAVSEVSEVSFLIELVWYDVWNRTKGERRKANDVKRRARPYSDHIVCH